MEASVATSKPFRLGRHPSLDGVRAVAVLSVVAVHFYNRVPFRGGYLGVDIFFVLSGFLITAILVQEFERRRTISFRAFYARRALRLFPALAVWALAILAYLLIARPPQVGANLRELAAVVGYVLNWYQPFANPPAGYVSHGWSLSVEEQFYLLWPILLLLALRRSPRTALGVALVGALASAIARAGEWHAGVSPRYVYASLDGRANELLAGAALALLLAYGHLDGRRARQLGRAALAPALLLVLAMLVFAGALAGYVYEGGAFVFSIAVAVVLANLVVWPFAPLAWLLERRPMLGIGRISYGIYLWHAPIFLVAREHTSRNLTAAAIAFPITLLVTAASYRFVELPFLRRKRRFEPPAVEPWPPAAAAAVS